MSEERQNEEHKNKVRLDQLLLNTGLVASRARARDAIQRGTVKVDGRTVTKPSFGLCRERDASPSTTRRRTMFRAQR